MASRLQLTIIQNPSSFPRWTTQRTICWRSIMFTSSHQYYPFRRGSIIGSSSRRVPSSHRSAMFESSHHHLDFLHLRTVPSFSHHRIILPLCFTVAQLHGSVMFASASVNDALSHPITFSVSYHHLIIILSHRTISIRHFVALWPPVSITS